MRSSYETKNYPFEHVINKETFEGSFQIETPWIDDDAFWKEAEAEILVDDKSPFLRIIKTDYKNGFKVISIENSKKHIIKTNWALDPLPNGNLLPRIQ
ncbi:hypothetical protein [Staphylococcus delphini]|uniref:hypothetical protein n=1 Tax=Staphylococcus delphini TaxID=53344 RepID=UPI000BBC2785|nr:hypothetical protein [Staphylococcus delphini]PCF79301.1 hypothetical protein B4W69_13170 [Staphylococcus delphini]